MFNYSQLQNMQISDVHIDIVGNVMQMMYEYIGKHNPERGGFLFGNVTNDNKEINVTNFVYDNSGSTSSVSYYPSTNSTDIIRNTEKQTFQMFLGVVHSHPSYLDHPSSPDISAMNDLLVRNPHMPCVISPIITNAKIKDQNYEKSLSSNIKISFFIKYRDTNLLFIPASVTILKDKIYENKVKAIELSIRDTNYVIDKLSLQNRLKRPMEAVITDFQETDVLMVKLIINSKDGDENILYIFFGFTYPLSPPILLHAKDQNVTQINLNWDILNIQHTNSNERFLSAFLPLKENNIF